MKHNHHNHAQMDHSHSMPEMEHGKEMKPGHENGYNKHAGHSLENFKRKFYISLFLISSFIFFFGGSPFLKGAAAEIKHRALGMMTLITLAISVAYFYSSAVTFGLKGEVFFWELATR